MRSHTNQHIDRAAHPRSNSRTILSELKTEDVQALGDKLGELDLWALRDVIARVIEEERQLGNLNQAGLHEATGVNAGQIANLLATRTGKLPKGRSLPGLERMRWLAAALIQTGALSKNTLREEVDWVAAERAVQGGVLKDGQIPAVAGPFSPEACLLRWCLAGNAEVSKVDLGAPPQLSEHLKSFKATPFFIRPLRRISQTFLHGTPPEDDGGRLNAPFALMSLNHAQAIDFAIRQHDVRDESEALLGLRYLHGFRIRSLPELMLVRRRATNPPPQEAMSRFRLELESSDSFLSGLLDLRAELNGRRIVVEDGTDLAFLTRRVCRLLGLSIQSSIPAKGRAKDLGGWVYLANPIRTASALQLLSMNCLDEKCVVVAEAAHYWAVKDRGDLEVLLLDSDLFPARNLHTLKAPEPVDDYVFGTPGRRPSHPDEAPPKEWMPSDYFSWVRGELERDPESLVPHTSYEELHASWPDTDRVIVAMPQIGLRPGEPLSPALLNYAGRYFCRIGREIRMKWKKDGRSTIMDSVKYQYIECYGGTGGSIEKDDAQIALQNYIQGGMRFFVFEDLEECEFRPLPRGPHASWDDVPDYLRHL